MASTRRDRRAGRSRAGPDRLRLGLVALHGQAHLWVGHVFGVVENFDVLTPAATARENVTLHFGAYGSHAQLSYPAGGGRHPVVVLIPGSGPEDRNADICQPRTTKVLSHNFADIATHLSARGYAVMRYDKRGVSGPCRGGSHYTLPELLVDAGRVSHSAAGSPSQLAIRPQLDTNHDGVLELDRELIPRVPRVIAVLLSPGGFLHIYAPGSALPVLSQQAAKLTLPALILQGGHDANVPAAGASAFQHALRAKDKMLKLYPELGHSLGPASSVLTDDFAPIARAPLADLTSWLDAHR
ncbi:MAG: alpha/beta hydrolase family protein [Solirubrobacteraceae bacterium]